MDLATVVTRADQAGLDRRSVWDLEDGYGRRLDERFHVVAYDFGVKRNILRLLASRGCRITVVPAETSAEEALALKPDGIFLSNGPGDPEPCGYAIEAIRTLLDSDLPIFGICLGHQLLALASGARTVKMPHGHHGANHPVKDLRTEQVIITSQNHGFAVDEESLPNCLEPPTYLCSTAPCRACSGPTARLSDSRATRKPARDLRTASICLISSSR